MEKLISELELFKFRCQNLRHVFTQNLNDGFMFNLALARGHVAQKVKAHVCPYYRFIEFTSTNDEFSIARVSIRTDGTFDFKHTAGIGGTICPLGIVYTPNQKVDWQEDLIRYLEQINTRLEVWC